jgi:hypothetical protein
MSDVVCCRELETEKSEYFICPKNVPKTLNWLKGVTFILKCFYENPEFQKRKKYSNLK